ncbi:MAG TPA: hypothetical protein P5186_26005 [Candidatus Paceibacterota bacterium]|nr:hypothetical protein [Verrucomicrobiota bacterium]HRY51514.1 hypothetical protein [Candidatus Paceibacterota bacterium]
MKWQLLRYEAGTLLPAGLLALLIQFVPPLIGADPGVALLVYALSGLGFAAWNCQWPWYQSIDVLAGFGKVNLRVGWRCKCLLLFLVLLTLALIPAGFRWLGGNMGDGLLWIIALVTIALATSTMIPLLVLLLENVWMAIAAGVSAWCLIVISTDRIPGSILQSYELGYDLGEMSFLMAVLVSWIASLASYWVGLKVSVSKEGEGGKARGMNRIAKECRNLMAPWTMGIALMVLAAVGLDPSLLWPAGFLACGLVAAAVFGNELNQHTLVLLLGQPISRRRLWYEKMLALAIAFLTVISLVTVLLIVLRPDARSMDSVGIMGVCVFAVFASVPMLTLWLRNSLAAMVFTPIIHFLAAMLVVGLGNWLLGEAYADYQDVVVQGSLFLVIGLSAIFYLAGCCLFQRFECRETQAVDFRWPRLRAWFPRLGSERTLALPAMRGHPLTKILWKDLHLHRINLMLSAIFCLGCLVMVGVHFLKTRAELAGDPQTFEFASEGFYLLPFFVYWVVAPLLIGAVGIAEERQLGVLEWHLLLPPSRWRQWFCKLVTAYGMSFLLAMVLPAAWLGGVYLPLGMMDNARDILTAYHWICLALLLATSVSIYAASLSTSTLKAVVNSLGLMILGVTVCHVLSRHLPRNSLLIMHYGFDEGANLWLNPHSVCIAQGGVLALLFIVMLGLSYTNFKRSERSWPQTFLVPAALAIIIGSGFSVWIKVYQKAQDLGLI